MADGNTSQQSKKLIIIVTILVIIAAIVILIGALVGTSLERLDSYEVGLKYDTIARSLNSKVQGEGLYAGAPGFRFIKFGSVFQTISFSDLQCLNKDGIPIILNISYQYRVRPNKLYDVVMEFKDNATYEQVLKHAGSAAIMESCSLFNTTQYQAERGVFQSDVGTKLTARYEQFHADVSEIQVNNIQRPASYDAAVSSKETARESITVNENERAKQLVEAAIVKEKATADATIAIAYAESEARMILDRANKTSLGIMTEFEEETNVYAFLKDVNGLQLTPPGFMSYISTRAIEGAKNDVHVGISSPATTVYPIVI